jgi:hypothetical protein
MKNLVEYFNPEEKIINALIDLEHLYIILNQEGMKILKEKGFKNYFSGNLYDYVYLKEVKELFEIEKIKNKPWYYLIKTIYLLENYSTEFDISTFDKFSDEEVNYTVNTFKKGIPAYNIIKEWLKDIENLKAIKDAYEISLKKFQILKIDNISEDKKDNFSIFKYILEIEDPILLIEYIKQQKLNNVLIVALVRNKVREFKSTFYLFLVFNGQLYSIDNSERRLNLDNTAGDRNPNRYIDRNYEGIWLPYELIFKENIKEGLILYNKVKVLGNWDEVEIGCKYWLELFLFRIIDYIKNNEIELGITMYDYPKLLEDKSILEKFNKPEDGGAGDYLLNLYKINIKDITVIDEKFLIIGTQKHITEAIQYKNRQILANNIQELVNKDYEEYKDEVKSWVEDFINSYNKYWLVKKALLNQEYTYKHFPHFCDSKEEQFYKESILTNYYNWFHNCSNALILSKYNEKCFLCNKYLMKNYLKLAFIDYFQFCEFFEVTEDKIHVKIKEHLHQQGEKYVGNSILDDTDPIDEIKDPWFKDVKSRMGGSVLLVCLGICNDCLRKYTPKEKFKEIKEIFK